MLIKRSLLLSLIAIGCMAIKVSAEPLPRQTVMIATGTIKPEAIEADRRLNRVYGEVMKEYANAKEIKAAIVQSQIKWLAYRDADCALWAKGVMPELLHHPSAAVSYGVRQRDLTLDRIKVLETLLSASTSY